MAAQYYKVTRPHGQPTHGVGRWPLPGEWQSVDGEIVPWHNAIHACEKEQLIFWLSAGTEVWTFELRGEIVNHGTNVTGREGRRLYRIANWNERTQRLFAADCAEHVLPLWEAEYPFDQRPHKAIGVARKYAAGIASAEELAAARLAAMECYRDLRMSEGARWAVRAAVEAAAATSQSALEAIWAAWTAVGSATREAWKPVIDAADPATKPAVKTAAWKASQTAEDTERALLTTRLFHYLEGKVE